MSQIYRIAPKHSITIHANAIENVAPHQKYKRMHCFSSFKSLFLKHENSTTCLCHEKQYIFSLVSFLYEKIKITPVFMANIFISGV